MTPIRRSPPFSPACHAGQAMIEYLVVLAFSVLLLIRPFPASELNPNAPPGQTQGSVVDLLAQAIRDYHQHYSFAMSIAYIPNCTYTLSADQTAIQSRIPQTIWPLSSFPITATASVTFDRCIDLLNPQIPMPSASSFSFGLDFDNITSDIASLMLSSVKSALSSYDPAGMLGSLINFDPSSFF
jgi:hypothetical protein